MIFPYKLLYSYSVYPYLVTQHDNMFMSYITYLITCYITLYIPSVL